MSNDSLKGLNAWLKSQLHQELLDGEDLRISSAEELLKEVDYIKGEILKHKILTMIKRLTKR